MKRYELKLSHEARKLIKDDAALRSFLYDYDLMPEQIRNKTMERRLGLAIRAFIHGRAAAGSISLKDNFN